MASYYVLKKPNGKHRRFALLRRVPGQKSKTVRVPELETVNRLYLEGTYDLDHAERAAKEIRNRMTDAERATPRAAAHLPANQKLLDRYWAEVYRERSVVDPKSEYNALRRAIGCLRNVPLLTDEVWKAQAAVDAAVGPNNAKYRRVAQKLRQLSRHFGKELKLKRKAETYREPVYLTPKEFEAAMDRETDPLFLAYCWVAFTTGARLGEIFALTEGSFNPKASTVTIRHQMKKDGQLYDTKNKRHRVAPVFKAGDAWISAWIEAPQEKKLALRQRSEKFSEMLRALSDKPGLTFHCLRHSYAKRLFNGGAPLEFVADAIGDDVKTARKRYVGWLLADSVLEILSKITRE